MQTLTLLIEEIPLQSNPNPNSPPSPSDPSEEDIEIFSSASSTLFNETRNLHGDASVSLLYHSAFGPLHLHTADPSREDERRLFAHHLWNAGLQLAEYLSGRRLPETEVERWNVTGQRVIELGAGVGLAGMIASANGASVVITDYPSETLLSIIRRNVTSNASIFADRPTPEVQGHEWGVFDSFAIENAHSFTRVLAADCFWMPEVHAQLVQSMLHFLSDDESARVFAIGGFHTGRAKLANFFTVADGLGLAVETIYEEDAHGRRRDWDPHRGAGREDPVERKNWLTVAILKRVSR